MRKQMLTTTSKTFEFTDPDAPGWVALVEVKGYTKGAKTEAPTQFLRFQKRHQQRTGLSRTLSGTS